MPALPGSFNLNDRPAPRGGAPAGQPDLLLPGQRTQRMGRDHLAVAAAARNSVPGASIAPVSRPSPQVAMAAASSPWSTGLESLVTSARAAVAAWTGAPWPGQPAPAPPPTSPAVGAAPQPAPPSPAVVPAPSVAPGVSTPPVPSVPMVPAAPAVPMPSPLPAPTPPAFTPVAFSGQGAWGASAPPPVHDPAYRAALDALRQLQEQHHHLPTTNPAWPPPAGVPLPPAPGAPPPPPPPP
ncbi:MAG: hypothetical protein VKS61_18255, partial [Candidatus Sericytochromatia bacterium]|nr:hypothetical protein [Candidatus Sericytochromatia bacterium]